MCLLFSNYNPLGDCDVFAAFACLSLRLNVVAIAMHVITGQDLLCEYNIRGLLR